MIEARPLDLNLLPARYRPRRISVPLVLSVLLAVAVLAGLWPVYGQFVATEARTDYLQTRFDQVKASLTQTQAERVRVEQRLAEIEEQMQGTQAQIIRLRTELDSLSQRRTSRSAGIVAAIEALVPRVQILGLVQTGDTLTVTGQAGSQALVLDYARSLQGRGQFANVRIVSMVNADPLGLAPEVTFSIEMEQ
jgi:Tfp pilus assembly protein PilN